MSNIRVGMIGYKFMGKAHSNAYRALPMFFPNVTRPQMVAICGRDAAGARAGARAIRLGERRDGLAQTRHARRYRRRRYQCAKRCAQGNRDRRGGKRASICSARSRWR